MSQNNIIKKSNNLVEAAYHLSLWEMRIILKMTSLIHLSDKDFKVYDIDVKDIKNLFTLESDGSVYTYIKDSVRSLMDKKITIRTKTSEGKTKETVIPMIIEMTRIVEEKSSISLSFHPLMKPYLLDLKSRFLTYDVDNILRLKSTYAIRIYELTKAYAGIGKRTFAIDELKKILGIEDKYKQYTHLKKRIIESSKDNINKDTDINLSYVEIKEGRKVVKIQFIISQKETVKVESKEKKDYNLGLYGISTKMHDKWRKEYGDIYIKARVKYMNIQIEKGANIKNKGGYLSSLMGKEINSKQSKSENITKKVNAILYSNPQLQKQIEAKNGILSQEAMNAVVRRMMPEKFI